MKKVESSKITINAHTISSQLHQRSITLHQRSITTLLIAQTFFPLKDLSSSSPPSVLGWAGVWCRLFSLHNKQKVGKLELSIFRDIHISYLVRWDKSFNVYVSAWHHSALLQYHFWTDVWCLDLEVSIYHTKRLSFENYSSSLFFNVFLFWNPLKSL